MRKLWILVLLLVCMLTSCIGSDAHGSAKEAVESVLMHFHITDGVVYGDSDEQYRLSDSMLSLMFDGDSLPEFEYVESCAAYFSRRFSQHELVVLRLYDMSHREELAALCKRRAEKKENAVVFYDGVYVYLICMENNGEIVSYLKGK